MTLESIDFPDPVIGIAIEPKTQKDIDKLGNGLAKLAEEDPTFTVRTDEQSGQTIISGMGELHLEIIIDRLKREFKVECNQGRPQVSYKEAITNTVDLREVYKKQSGGRGKFADMVLKVGPADEGFEGNLQFIDEVKGGNIPKEFIPAIQKGFTAAMRNGVLAGFPMDKLKVVVVDGSYHPVDSSEMAFKLAATLAYKAGLKDASPCLLEPIGTLDAYVPDNNAGDVMGEVNKRRGRVLGIEPVGDGMQKVSAECPMSEMSDFTTYIRSLTAGRGHFTLEFARYEQLPSHMEGKVIEEAKKFIVAKYDEE
jgi:elongation factor G